MIIGTVFDEITVPMRRTNKQIVILNQRTMKHLLFIIPFLFSSTAYSQSAIDGFFKPIPKPTDQQLFDTDVIKQNKWRPSITLPALKLVESSRDDAVVDALVLTSTGGGISYQMLEYDSKAEKWKSNFSFSPATILLSGNLTSDNPIDISYAMTLGIFDDMIMLGGGIDLGSVTGRSRWFGMISIGVSLNN